jgi:hypothetical protein
MRPSPILLSVALLCAAGQVLASESRQLGPDGSSSCPESATGTLDETDSDAPAAPAPRAAHKVKPATPAARSAGGSNGQRSTTPRWHSFLPGMFR